ncbi:DivIVA domain-containing protein [Micromonospora olivasterospora]|uniref:DivIVA domain-containing protein n=1 Tax=Micromonospora olivasterospora TaxID=1880 RepID=A0A562I7S3_MICOL|nr:DivIVA domain-containing protein [Micromonospora olivasterospora]TWH66828.1 DivIVA domain-containing protein [Micromonospora olivasterospora]
MRQLVERLLGRRSAVPERAGGTAYRSASCVPLRPADVRTRRFGRTRLGRRGLDPDEVLTFLDRVAAELADAQRAAERARGETHRIKDALRRWQSEQAQARDLLRNANQRPAGYRPAPAPGPALLPYR